MTTNATPIERIVSRVRRNPFVATGIAVGVVVIWLAGFTEAVRKLRALLPDEKPAAVAGGWLTEVLQDPRTQLDFRYAFELKTDGRRVYGSARRAIPACAARPDAGVCAGHDRAVAIVDGTIEKTAVAFDCDWGELPGGGPWSYVKVRERFRGTVDGRSMRLVVQDDQGRVPVETVAVLQ